MSRYVAFLRGINVGGHRVTSQEFREHFARLGCSDVTTYRTSGNVIFTAEDESPEQLVERIEAGLAASLGYAVPVFLRTAAQTQAIAAYEPFPVETVAASAGKLQVMLLRETPSAAAAQIALALSTDEDRLTLHDRELYWLPSGGLMDSALDLKAIGAALGVTTLRTKNTVDLIASKLGG